MAVERTTDHRFKTQLNRDGMVLRRGVVPGGLVSALAAALDRAVAEESADFPTGDDQHGRLLFAPSHGGPFIEMCGFDPLFAPIELLLGEDSIIYTMTSSVLRPGEPGPASLFHVDLPTDRPDGLALAAMVLLDPFTRANGATEFLIGSHRPNRETTRHSSGETRLVTGDPGDVCYFDPRTLHRSTLNESSSVRRAVLLLMIKPWMKQRVDVAAMLGGELMGSVRGASARRLGLESLPPSSREEFMRRRDHRPW